MCVALIIRPGTTRCVTELLGFREWRVTSKWFVRAACTHLLVTQWSSISDQFTNTSFSLCRRRVSASLTRAVYSNKTVELYRHHALFWSLAPRMSHDKHVQPTAVVKATPFTMRTGLLPWNSWTRTHLPGCGLSETRTTAVWTRERGRGATDLMRSGAIENFDVYIYISSYFHIFIFSYIYIYMCL